MDSVRNGVLNSKVQRSPKLLFECGAYSRSEGLRHPFGIVTTLGCSGCRLVGVTTARPCSKVDQLATYSSRQVCINEWPSRYCKQLPVLCCQATYTATFDNRKTGVAWEAWTLDDQEFEGEGLRNGPTKWKPLLAVSQVRRQQSS